MLFLCKFTDYALNLEIAENNISNKDKICLSKILISETEIKGGKQRRARKIARAKHVKRLLHPSEQHRKRFISHQEEQMDT